VAVTTQAAFLRGINVGKTKRIAMADLRALVTGLGYADVRTHLQSGNVVYRTATSTRRAAAAIEHAVEAELAMTVPVVARTAAELAGTVAADPLGDVVDDPSRYLVVFLDAEPTAAAFEAVTAAAADDERLALRGRELYAWLPGGIHSSRAGAALARGLLGVQWTGRNWTTVTKVLDLTRG
jgi:uncharacterized protein (DUF1697 family)